MTFLKAFIAAYVEEGNTIIIDAWAGNSFLDSANSGYLRIQHIIGSGDFVFGTESSLHIENIWSQIKGKMKESYHICPYRIFMPFIREFEYKIK